MPTPVSNPAGVAAVQDILKEVWVEDRLQSQLYEDTFLMDYVDEVTQYTDSDGLKASVPLKVGRTGGISARGIGKKLAPADHQRPGKASYNYKNLYAQVEINGPIIAKMATQRQAAVREIDFEVEGALHDFSRDFCRQLHANGDARLTLAALPGNAASTTVALGASNYPQLERGWLYEGQVLDLGTDATPTAIATGVRIVSVDDSNAAAPTITLDTSVTPLSTTHIYLYGNRDATDGSYEINGLGNVVDKTSVLGGIDPTAAGKTYWKSIVEDNSGTLRALSLSLLNTTARRVRAKGAKPTDIVGDLLQEQKYYELLQSQVRFTGGEGSIDAGGIQKPTYNGMTFQADPDCQPSRIYFLSKKALQMYSAGKVAWQNQTTGGDILSWRQDYDSFVARAAKYCNLGTNRRVSLGVLKDLNNS